ncbi:hypothetical protein HYX06_02530 [Candidatus Woesearchaeota archaeon]|nr:hypothetical protein [Candidatus Woesearchaeota archaeon]
MPNNIKLRKTLIDKLAEAQKYLVPLFKLSTPPNLSVEIDPDFGTAYSDEEKGSPLIVISASTGNYPIGHHDAEFWDHAPSDTDIGEIATKFLYHKVNPDVFMAGRELFKQQIRKHEDRALIGVQNDQDSRLSHAYVDLGRIVKYCGGQIYINLKKLTDKGKANEQTERILELTERMARRDYDMFTPVTLVSLQSQSHAENVGKTLLEARNVKVIPELAYLNFEQARAYILQHTGMDILSVPYSGSPGRIVKPPKSIS